MMENTQALYPAYCTECGRKIETRLFSLNNLLKQYHFTGIVVTQRDAFLNMMRIYAEFGQTVLPEVSPLVKEGKYQSPDLGAPAASKETPKFACADNKIPMGQLVEPPLNIASIIAQFACISGFREIYKMLALVWEKKQAENSLAVFPAVQQDKLNRLCDKFIALPYVHMPAMAADAAALRSNVENVLSWVLNAAVQEEREEMDPNKKQFSLSPVKIGWRYKICNNREIPDALIVVDGGGKRHNCTICCCKHCFTPILKELGAYPQRIIGLLGSQQTGKTSYLAAVADSLVHGNVASAIVDGELKVADMTFELQADEQKKRIYEEETGLLWLYQHGFPPHKTNVLTVEDTSAPTFLVKLGGEKSGSVFCTLADIAGEAFLPDAGKSYSQAQIDGQKELLKSCSALILVINSQQMSASSTKTSRNGSFSAEDTQSSPDDSSGKNNSKLVNEPQDILNSCKDFLPDNRSIPIAIVMTAADRINGGNLRKPLRLAYDLRKLSPWVWSGKCKRLLLNYPMLNMSSKAVEGYLNQYFGVFTKTLEGILKEKYKGTATLAAFAVSNGTQMAPVYYTEASEEDKTVAACNKRLDQVRSARFGIAAPLLWLLAQSDFSACSHTKTGPQKASYVYNISETE